MKAHILVVDDEPAIRYLILLTLQQVGYEVSQAQDGADALGLILKASDKQKAIDLVVTDIQMPGMSGMELIQELNKQKMSIPILVVSGIDDMDLIRSLRNHGCPDFLLKPFDFGEFTKRVEVLLGGGNQGEDRRNRRLEWKGEKHRPFPI